MPAPINTFKSRLANGEVLHGCWIGLADAYAAEIAATAGFDWLLIDGEHAPNDLRSISDQLARVLPSASHAIVRTADDNPATIKQVLDIGAQSLLIPMVETADQANAIYRATRYAPEGMRGVGSALARASQFSAIPDYVQTANDQICIIVQVETVKGLENLDAIAGVRGIDGIFIGPADLAADMGYPGQTDHPDVHAAIMDALSRIRAAGLSAGMLGTAPDFVADCKTAGANFVGVGIDVTLFAGAMRGLAAQYT